MKTTANWRSAAARKAWETIRAKRGLAPKPEAPRPRREDVRGEIALPCSLNWAGNHYRRGTVATYRGYNPKLGKGVLIIGERELHIPSEYISGFEWALGQQQVLSQHQEAQVAAWEKIKARRARKQ